MNFFFPLQIARNLTKLCIILPNKSGLPSLALLPGCSREVWERVGESALDDVTAQGRVQKLDSANNALGLGCGLSCADIDFPLGSKLGIQLRSLLCVYYVDIASSVDITVVLKRTRGRMGRERGTTVDK